MASSTSIPRTIGRFRIEALLGAGGMGEVYKGVDPVLKRSVAVKTVRPGLGGAEYEERLYREAQACAALQHPNIVTIYEVGEFDGGVFIAMEYLKGHNLGALVEVGALTLGQRLSVLMQVLDALAHAHGEQVVHRDIKPSNVHVLPDGSIKLLDFGLARMQAAETITLSGAVMGTPHYASPEQLRAERVDARSDLFSTGAMAYQLLEGRRPFEADTISAVIIKVLTDPPAPVHGAWSREFPALEAVVQRAMAKNPADRYQTADEMRHALASVAASSASAIAAFDVAHPAKPLPAVPSESVRVAASASTPDPGPAAVPWDGATVRTDAVPTTTTTDGAAVVVPSPSATGSTLTPVGRQIADGGWPARASSGRRPLAIAAAVGGALLVVVLGYGRLVRIPAGGAGHNPAETPLGDTFLRAAVSANDGPPPTGGDLSASAAAPRTAPADVAAAASAGADKPPARKPAASPSAATTAAVVPSAAAGAVPVVATQARQLFVAAPGTVRNAGLKWRVIRKLDSGEELDVEPDQTFRSGDRVRLAFESNIDGFLYVAHQGSTRRWTLLFPGETINGGSNAVSSGQMYQVPDNGWFRFDDTPGDEELFVVLSKERFAEMPGFQGRVRRSDQLPPKAIDDLRLRMSSRDLIFEKDPPPAKESTAVKPELAQYVVNRDELGKAVSATITLKHAR